MYPAYAGCGGCCGSIVAAPMYMAPSTTAPLGTKPEIKPETPPMKKPGGEGTLPKPGNKPSDKKTGDTSASVRIYAPMDVQVTFNGVAVTRQSATEVFTTPALEVGQPYHYTVTAKRGDKTETKIVAVAAGSTVEVDLREVKTVASR